MDISRTERRNPKSMHFDRLPTDEMATLVITANYEAVRAAEDARAAVAAAADAAAEAFGNGGRLFYVGAGTSGRIGVMDAAECPPTFGVPREQVQGILAGGPERMFRAGEDEEDDGASGRAAVAEHGIGAQDVVVGLSAAGNAAFVVGALEEAARRGAVTVAVSSNPAASILNMADIPIFTDTGEEILTGSTRLKAGTAQKIVLNTITTCAMAKTGKVYENMMVNLSPSNEKLRGRVVRIVSEILHCDETTALAALQKNAWNIRAAVGATANEWSEKGVEANESTKTE